MRIVLLLGCVALLEACGPKIVERRIETVKTYPPPPKVPPLPEALKDPCPGLKPLADGSVKTLVEMAAEDSVLYAACKKKAMDVISRYETVKREQDSYQSQIKRIQP